MTMYHEWRKMTENPINRSDDHRAKLPPLSSDAGAAADGGHTDGASRSAGKPKKAGFSHLNRATRRRRAYERWEEYQKRKAERKRREQDAKVNGAPGRLRLFFRRRLDDILGGLITLFGLAILIVGAILLPLPIPLGLPMILIGGFMVVQRIPFAKRAWRNFRANNPVWDHRIQHWLDRWDSLRMKHGW